MADTAARKIDVHHHIIPDFYRDLLAQLTGPGGISPPSWSREASLEMMDRLNIDRAILSLSAPGALIAGTREDVRALARRWNDHAAEMRALDPLAFGFFAALPGLGDQVGTIAEIQYAMGQLKAEGVTLFTSYAGQYLGAKAFEPIWAELDKHHAVVHVHPIHVPGTPSAAPLLPQPLIDYPHETARTASDLVLSGRKRQYPKCKIILSHAGGTLPSIAERVAVLRATVFSGVFKDQHPSSGEIMEDFKSFYFDLALGGSAGVLNSLIGWAPSDHILYGSDFPFAGAATQHFDTSLKQYATEQPAAEGFYRENALTLFPLTGSIRTRLVKGSLGIE
ncbi:MAG: hypothetical protein Q9222_006718 [Ikaeria aurantiellina]